ncbi:hypothetical protein O3297_05025 [Janthinobacterium sp. SUN128]|uniref:Uncharacterized protein n=1 Tax=Janthinobacterium lividum TaxID=29581 RepID=A0AAJ4MY69_9BURK|nr:MULTISPECIES: hypothetical protein [Janthinobacterium]KAB0324766.1 hypothetical protein F3B38_13690 [Janthinobacterium lividum]MDO8032763.1 hypothetical protein [Janthinobacterium sp. SUN128]QSX98877.1 hypothetical protein J3P46_13795 [Janthinobacterium lividum]UGQ38852.1 hypothetical protein LSO07_13645 [Janthinobacterium sp. PLB04]
MIAVNPNNFIVTFDAAGQNVAWKYDGAGDAPVCAAGESQRITFSFVCSDRPQTFSVVATLTAQPMAGSAGAPFVQGAVVPLTNPTTLTVSTQAGDWDFGIAFTATWPAPDGYTVSANVPDPELQVGSIPPG